MSEPGTEETEPSEEEIPKVKIVLIIKYPSQKTL